MFSFEGVRCAGTSSAIDEISAVVESLQRREEEAEEDLEKSLRESTTASMKDEAVRKTEVVLKSDAAELQVKAEKSAIVAETTSEVAVNLQSAAEEAAVEVESLRKSVEEVKQKAVESSGSSGGGADRREW